MPPCDRREVEGFGEISLFLCLKKHKNMLDTGLHGTKNKIDYCIYHTKESHSTVCFYMYGNATNTVATSCLCGFVCVLAGQGPLSIDVSRGLAAQQLID